MKRIFLISWLLLVCHFGRADVIERQILEACNYASDAAAQKAWLPVENSLPVQASIEIKGRLALRLPCDLTGAHRRAAWDKSLQSDLSRADRIAFWLYVNEPDKLAASYSFYLQSGGGWYGASFSAEAGWQRVVLDKSQFRTEGTPLGWDKISGLRISAWKDKDAVTFMAIDDIEAISSPIAVVMGSNAFDDGGEEQTVRNQAKIMTGILGRLGLETGVLTDGDVEKGALNGRLLAILPYNPKISDSEAAQLEKFIAAGGKVLAFYQAPPRLLAALGLKSDGWQKEDFDGQMAEIEITGLDGAPPKLKQHSWNLTKVLPVAKNAKIIGEWLDSEHKSSGLPALALSDSGAFMTHILLADDIAAKDQLMLALIGHFLPDVWPQAVNVALQNSAPIGEFDSLDALRGFVEKSARPDAIQHLNTAQQAMADAKKTLEQKQYVAALQAAQKAHENFAGAYAAAQNSKTKEMRAVWCHSAFGVAGMSWDAAIKKLADSGFNTIMPNMLWGGRAFYQSKLLPLDESVSPDNDQIAKCLAAAKKDGIKVHVWKVNWNLSNAPRDFLEKMRAAKRTQKDPQGKDIDWLCPSNPENFALERDSMLEVARNYDVDGLHFDYIRYPGPEGCYCDGCRARFEALQKTQVVQWPQDVIRGNLKAAYLEFRRDNITRLIKAVSEEAHKIKPGIKISAAVFNNWPQCRDQVGQDWANWIKAGYLDFMCPMDYTDKPRQYEKWMQTQIPAMEHKVPFVPGVGVTLGDWTLQPDEVIQQINIARRHNADGFILFNYTPYVASDILPLLRIGVTAKNATLP